MSRWLVLAVFSIAPLVVGCGSSVRSGLANAPRLGTAPTVAAPTVDDRVSDVISNGDDACGLYTERGVLRNKIPPCPPWTGVAAVGGSALRPVSVAAPNGGLVEPWLNHFYSGWPCSPKTQASRSIDWSASGPALAACSVP
jgi:hypothetical protein